MMDLEVLLQEGTARELLDRCLSWSEKERSAAYKRIRTYWKEAKKSGATYAFTERPDLARIQARLAIVNILASPSPKAALEIPLPSDRVSLDLFGEWRTVMEAEFRSGVLEAIAWHDREWAAEYVALSTQTKAVLDIDIGVTLALIEAFELPWPDGANFYRIWAAHLSGLCGRLGIDGVSSEASAKEVLDQLHLDEDHQVVIKPLPSQTQLAAWTAVTNLDRLFEGLFRHPNAMPGFFGRDIRHYPKPFAHLVAALFMNGKFDRVRFVACALAALTRCDAVASQRFQVDMLNAAQPSTSELAPHIDLLLGLLATGHSITAATAQRLLRAADSEKRLPLGTFVSACQTVFARKDKGLHAEQLAWAEARVKVDGKLARECLVGVTVALQLEDLSLQKRAIRALRKHGAKLNDEERAVCRQELDLARTALADELYREALEILGGPIADYQDRCLVVTNEPLVPCGNSKLKRVVYPDRIDVATVAELYAQSQVEYSRITHEPLIYAVLDLAKPDSAVAEEALSMLSSYEYRFLSLWQLARYRGLSGLSIHCSTWHFESVLAARDLELARAIKSRAPHPLISRPDWDNGSIDAATLVDRLRRLQVADQEAPPVDLFVALLRSTQPSEDELAALYALRTRQAKIAAEFFAAGGMSQMTTSWQVVPSAGGSQKPEVMVALRGLAVAPAIPGIPLHWADGCPASQNCGGYGDSDDPRLASLLPNHGETLFAMYIWDFRKASHDEYPTFGKTIPQVLRSFLHARGPAGAATHLAVLFSLSGNYDETRIAASDALLEVIAQDRYDSDLACDLVTACIGSGTVKVTRLAKSLGQATAAAGAAQVLWPLVCSAVAAVLAQQTSLSGAHDLLALASRIARRLGKRDVIPHLSAAAATSSGSKLVAEARQLHKLLEG